MHTLQLCISCVLFHPQVLFFFFKLKTQNIFKNSSLCNSTEVFPPGGYSLTQRSGNGTLKTAQNCIYEGSWDRDMKHGAGKELYSNGDMYEGTFELNRVSHAKYVHVPLVCLVV